MSDASNIDTEPRYDPWGRLVYSDEDRKAIQRLLDSDAKLAPGITTKDDDGV